MNLLRYLLKPIGRWLAHFLQKTVAGYEEFAKVDPLRLSQILQPGDILLVEGNSRISLAIKYLTQSTWSHACLFTGSDPDNPLVEVDLTQGVISIPIDKYASYNVRICRPVGLKSSDCDALIEYIEKRLGNQYDHSNIIDLMRYLLPTPPVPVGLRRQMLAFGSGDPTKAICSTLIAQAFQTIRYPILPRTIQVCRGQECSITDQLLLETRHYSHFVPRDFDLSPYFTVIKPTLSEGFDYHRIQWVDE